MNPQVCNVWNIHGKCALVCCVNFYCLEYFERFSKSCEVVASHVVLDREYQVTISLTPLRARPNVKLFMK